MIVARYDVMIDWAELKALPAPLNDMGIQGKVDEYITCIQMYRTTRD